MVGAARRGRDGGAPPDGVESEPLRERQRAVASAGPQENSIAGLEAADRLRHNGAAQALPLQRGVNRHELELNRGPSLRAEGAGHRVEARDSGYSTGSEVDRPQVPGAGSVGEFVVHGGKIRPTIR